MTVLDLVLEAGGINEFAAPDNTKLYRKTGASTKVFDIRLGEILKEGRLETNVELQPGDVVTVPERLF
jgi:polysaccharide export outer membrane protein